MYMKPFGYASRYLKFLVAGRELCDTRGAYLTCGFFLLQRRSGAKDRKEIASLRWHGIVSLQDLRLCYAKVLKGLNYPPQHNILKLDMALPELQYFTMIEGLPGRTLHQRLVKILVFPVKSGLLPVNMDILPVNMGFRRLNTDIPPVIMEPHLVTMEHHVVNMEHGNVTLHDLNLTMTLFGMNMIPSRLRSAAFREKPGTVREWSRYRSV